MVDDPREHDTATDTNGVDREGVDRFGIGDEHDDVTLGQEWTHAFDRINDVTSCPSNGWVDVTYTNSCDPYEGAAPVDSPCDGTGYAVSELRDTVYGMKEFELEDPDGSQLWFGQD